MSDELRKLAVSYDGMLMPSTGNTLRRAADEIDRLTQRVAELDAEEDAAGPINPEWLLGVMAANKWWEHSMYFSNVIDTPTPIEVRLGPLDEDFVLTASLYQGAGPFLSSATDDCVVLRDLRTRGEVRRLCSVLGVPLREEWKQPCK